MDRHINVNNLRNVLREETQRPNTRSEESITDLFLLTVDVVNSIILTECTEAYLGFMKRFLHFLPL